MKTSKKIGRLTLLKYCLISVAVILIIPLVIGLAFQIFTDEQMSIATFFDILLKDLDGNEIFILTQILVIMTGIWLIGGAAGRLIIDKESPSFWVGGLTFFLLWVILFTSSTLTSAIENTMTWGQKGFESAVMGWLIHGLFLFLIFGVVHGLAMGYLMGQEMKRKGRKIRNNDRPKTAIANGG